MSRSRLSVENHESHVVLSIDTGGSALFAEGAIVQDILQLRQRGWRVNRLLVLQFDPEPIPPLAWETLATFLMERALAFASWVEYPSPAVARVIGSNDPARYPVGQTLTLADHMPASVEM